MCRFRRSALLAAMLLLGVPSLPAQQPPPGLDAYVGRVMATFVVPGLSVAIVKDGRVVLARGYGVRRMGKSEPVDAATRFGIASNTKLFTATALTLLVEEGKVAWDRPVIDYLPAFALSDPYVTRELTVRDLLVHRSGLGLGAGDLLWWPPSTYEPEGDRPPAPVHPARHLLPQRLCLRQRALPRGRRGSSRRCPGRPGRSSSGSASWRRST